MEFSKKIVVWVLVFTTLAAAASYILAAHGHESCVDIALYSIKFGVATVAAYAAKSLLEKALRDIFGLDKNGRPYSLDKNVSINKIIDDEEIGG